MVRKDKMQINRLGFFLGSFDPPHIGHLQVAIECLNNNLVDKIIYVPAKQNPFKKASINISHRVNMLNCMINEYNLNKVIEVSSIEMDLDSNDNGEVYSYITLNVLFNKVYKDYDCYWILTDETFGGVWLWKNYDNMLRKFHKYIGSQTLPHYFAMKDIVRYNNIKGSFNIYNTPHSSDLRKLIKEKKNVYPFICKSVYNYIKQNNLYI